MEAEYIDRRDPEKNDIQRVDSASPADLAADLHAENVFVYCATRN